VIASDAQRRRLVIEACRAAGIAVIGVAHVAEIERWPHGDIVITDVAHLTTWWRTVGAVEVIALVEHPPEGLVALQNGATSWLDPQRVSELTLRIVSALHSRDE
jgi:hypothetical protein